MALFSTSNYRDITGVESDEENTENCNSLDINKAIGVNKQELTDEEDIINEELLQIQQLDASIYDLELKMQEISNDLKSMQVENREKLKQLLESSPPECGLLAKNTVKFFNLCNIDQVDEISHEISPNLPEKTSAETLSPGGGLDNQVFDLKTEELLIDEETQQQQSLSSKKLTNQ